MHENILSHVDLFANLEKKELQVLSKACQERHYSVGTKIISQGDTGVGLYVIKSGRVRVVHTSSAGEEEDLDIAGAGDVLGEMSLLDDLPRSASVIAIDDVAALLLPIWEFHIVLQSHPDISIKLLAILSRRLRKAENRSRE